MEFLAQSFPSTQYRALYRHFPIGDLRPHHHLQKEAFLII